MNQRDLPRKRAPERCSVQFAQWTAREAGLNDAEYIHVGGDGALIRGFSGCSAGAGEVAAGAESPEGFYAPRAGYCYQFPGMGWVSTQSPTTGYSSSPVVLNRTQRSEGLMSSPCSAGQQLAGCGALRSRGR